MIGSGGEQLERIHQKLDAGRGEQDHGTVEDLDAFGGALFEDALRLLANPVGGAQLRLLSHALIKRARASRVFRNGSFSSSPTRRRGRRADAVMES